MTRGRLAAYLLFIGLLSLPLITARAVLDSDDLPSRKALAVAPVTVQGIVRFEGATNHAGIRVEMWREGMRAQTIGVQSTDVYGNYSFRSVDPGYPYSISAASVSGRFAGADVWISASQLQAAPGVFIAPEMILLRPRRFVLGWVYQPDGSPSFVSGSPTSGAATLTSSCTRWVELGTFLSSQFGTPDLCLAQAAGSCQDLFVGNRFRYPNCLWSSNGQGGVHDMGQVALESITLAPDKSAGVGAGKVYNNQCVQAIVGHSYVLVAQDGQHYAKFAIRSSETVSPTDCYLPLVNHAQP